MKRVISIGFLGRFLLITVLFLSHVPFQLVNASTEVFDSLNDFESESSNIKEGEEELDESESEPEKANEGSRSTQYRIDLIANPPRGGTAINLATNSTVIWGDVGMGFGNVTAIPNTGYHFVEWEVVSGPVNLLSPTNLFPALIMGAGNSVVQAMFAPVQGGNIIVKHEDAEGNKLVEDEILAGLFDEEYSTEALTIEGWNVSRIPSNASGTFTQEEQVVLYLYERYEPQQNLWGTVPWEYDEEAESIILYGGIAGSVTEAPWRTYTSVKQITIENIVVLPENSRGLFSSLNNLETIEHAENLDVSNVENMYNMFGAARSIKHLDVSRWDTSNVRNMSFMFNQTQSLKELDVSNWDTSQVTNMQAMFQNAESLTTLDVSSWNTSQVTNMGFMFNQMQSLKEVDVGNWDTSQVTNMRMMFNNGNSLTTLDVSRWNTSQITDMGFMFNQMRSLKELDMSNWDTSQVTNMQSIFGNTNALNRITLGEQSIFSAATNLPAIPSTEQYTGRWTLEENLSGDGSVITFENSTEFMANYDGSSPGTYIWERVAPEQLVASIDRVSDQSQTITGYATESVDELTISYQTTSGDKVVLEKDDPRIVWGDYQESNQHVRQFQIDLIGNERLETETKVTITVSKPSVVTTGDRTEEQTVIKGIDYRANNLTLDRFKINELSTQEELDALILQESRAQAANVLSEADMTDDFRIVETDLTREVDEDGSYFAVLEVGNKAYQLIVGIDVTSKLEHMRVTIPTKMVFESLYNTAESNRNFESQGYEIRNQSPLAVDTYINQLAIDDPAGIVLLEEGEDPLDYAESEEEDPTLTYYDISTPLLRLNLKTEETQIQLYETMEEQHLVRLEERSRVLISLTGDFYGDYPQWVVDSEADQGGYYEDLLVPNYRIVLRFVPRD
ncbi:BspA family leucine-rich repeat surface protein [Enterococcus innesii]|uniref:BspA family leucine-rich repeat surface protein n=1 Tax=Enterococcus innesii TaxID=2839759 RepID=UPI003B5CB737